MAIVWPCPVSVEVYAADGRAVSVPRQVCPSCAVPMVFWSGYCRSVRVDDRWWRVWIVRARCRGCRVSHGLLPSFLLSGRQDQVEVIGRYQDARRLGPVTVMLAFGRQRIVAPRSTVICKPVTDRDSSLAKNKTAFDTSICSIVSTVFMNNGAHCGGVLGDRSMNPGAHPSPSGRPRDGPCSLGCCADPTRWRDHCRDPRDRALPRCIRA